MEDLLQLGAEKGYVSFPCSKRAHTIVCRVEVCVCVCVCGGGGGGGSCSWPVYCGMMWCSLS